MLLTTGLLMEFGRFLQILSWIFLPVLLISVGITVWHHYRKKGRKPGNSSFFEEEFLAATPDQSGEPGRKGAYLLFDHSGLIRQYQHKLSYNHARYAALKQDFEKLELKYSASNGLAETRLLHINQYQMENTAEQIQEMPDRLSVDMAGKNELLERLERLDQSYKSLEKENESLLDQLRLQSASEEGKEIIFNRWREENNSLKEQASASQCLRDLVAEKRAQIEFLQTQAEQRIKAYHDGERQRLQMKDELDQSKLQYQKTLDELDFLKAEAANYQQLVGEKEQKLEETTLLLHTQNDQLLYMENLLKEVKQQNELLNAAVGDSQEKIDILQDHVEFEEGRVKALEQKLQTNRQLLHRLYREFSSCIDEEIQSSPVVTLRSSYMNDVEEVVQ
jgi:chromosome segregation ATPase